MATFKHSGKLGDILWSLPFIRNLGGGHLFLEIGVADYDGGFRLTQQGYESIKPFLEMQDYITGLNVYEGGPVDYDLDRFREIIWEENCSLADSFFIAYGQSVDPSIQTEPWLTVVSSPSITPKKVVVSRTKRYLGNTPIDHPFYHKLVRQGLGEQGVFIGFDEEHKWFQELYGVQIEHIPTRDVVEMASVISGCDLWVGNEGLSFTIAEGLKKTAVLEINKGQPGIFFCAFRRANLLYV